jgi:DNA-binding transcriptional LysR family regulator
MYKTNINLNLYKTFYDVAKYGSISKAAQYGFTSQPAISKSIKKLEAELGTQLFYRNLTGVELTDKGKELLYFVEKSYSNLIIAERTMLETENLERGKLSIGMPSNIGSFFLFDKIINFHKKYPNIEITIITGSTSKLISLLDSHKVDFVIDTSPINVKLSEGMKITKLDEVQYCFVIKKDTKSLEYKNINKLCDLKNKPLILPISGTSNRNDLDELLLKQNIDIENVINIHTSEMIISAVKKDLGIGYIIYNLVEDDIKNGEVEILDIKEKLPTAEINIIFDKSFLTTAPKKFIENYIDYEFDL